MKKGETKMLAKQRDLPATVGLVYEVRDELKAEIRALDHKTESGFNKVDSRFKEIDARFNQIDARFDKMDARINRLEEKFDLSLAAIHRVQAIVEEQRSENRIMYETLLGINQRMNRLEERQDQVENTVLSFSKLNKDF